MDEESENDVYDIKRIAATDSHLELSTLMSGGYSLTQLAALESDINLSYVVELPTEQMTAMEKENHFYEILIGISKEDQAVNLKVKTDLGDQLRKRSFDDLIEEKAKRTSKDVRKGLDKAIHIILDMSEGYKQNGNEDVLNELSKKEDQIQNQRKELHDAYIRLAEKEEDFNSIQENLDKATEVYSDHFPPIAFSKKAEAYSAERNWSNAANTLEQALKIVGKVDDFDVKKTKKSLAKELENVKGNIEAEKHYLKSQDFLEKGKLRSGLRELKKAGKLQNNWPEVSDALKDVEGKWKKYEDKYHDFIKIGDVAMEGNEFGKAIEHYETAINMEEIKRSEPWNKKTEALIQLEDYDSAITNVEVTLGKFPGSKKTMNLVKKIKTGEAELDVRMRKAGDKYGTGKTLHYFGKYKKAIKEFEACLKLNENHQLAKEHLDKAKKGLKIVRRKRWEKATVIAALPFLLAWGTYKWVEEDVLTEDKGVYGAGRFAGRFVLPAGASYLALSELNWGMGDVENMAGLAGIIGGAAWNLFHYKFWRYL